MKNSKYIFHILFVLFHILLVIVALYVDSQRDNFSFLLKLQKYIPSMKYMAFFGLILLGVNYLLILVDRRSHNQEAESLKKENNVLKAKMFDLQEAQKESKPSGTSEKAE
jgi:hypothetical protein